MKARRSKKSTPHQRNHRWESFTTKIAKFNSLQPLRKVRRHDLDTEDLSQATSYFQTGLQRWSELNMSKPFVAFKQQARPLCESLAQILHFETRIMDLLAEHISIHDKEALEPLLDLLTAFAHDLGARFEKYYSRSLDLVLAIAGKPQAVEVIEWTFGTLAFLFKYLSKLLLPDLRPTFDVLAPLLGKSRHPPHIARFAAEALSFLVKKAAAPSHREVVLPRFVQHVRDDLISVAGDRQFLLYNDGLMSMFAEAAKGTDNKIHSAGPAILAALIGAIPITDNLSSGETVWEDLVCGVLTSTIHHSTADSFAELANSVLDTLLSTTTTSESAHKLSMPYLKILGVLAGVRKGYRITNWGRLIDGLLQILESSTKIPVADPQSSPDFMSDEFVFNVSTICHRAPIDALIPHIGRLMQVLTREPYMPWFIPLCSCLCEMDSSRFESLFKADFQK